jgi:glucose/arabinose dehydrogenase
MKRVISVTVILLAVGLVLYVGKIRNTVHPVTTLPATAQPSGTVSPQRDTGDQSDIPKKTVVADNLDTPWAIAFLPDGSMLVTERPGRVKHIVLGKKTEQVADIGGVREIGEGGLLGIALHPEFSSNHFVFVYYTYSGSGDNTMNRVVRMTFRDGTLADEKLILDAIPGASNHNGGRLKFGPDNFLYVSTGDAQDPSLAQDKNSLAGKILRVTDTGDAAPGNPFGNRTYSYGHRNPQGLAWDSVGRLWATEHGPSGGSLGTGNDEVNLIGSGKNYGWPTIQGTQSQNGLETPVLASIAKRFGNAGSCVRQIHDVGACRCGVYRGKAIFRRVAGTIAL